VLVLTLRDQARFTEPSDQRAVQAGLITRKTLKPVEVANQAGLTVAVKAAASRAVNLKEAREGRA